MANVNQEGFERRYAAVEQILKQHGLEATAIHTVAYAERSPFPFNNFIYKADLVTPALPSSFPKKSPGTTPPPADGVSSIIIRLSNPHALGMNNTHRVQNEVSSQFLVRGSLADAGLPGLVPAVYAWSAPKLGSGVERISETDFGWSLAEFKEGADLDGQFPSLTLDDKKAVLGEIASILVAIQKTKLPATADKFGALTLDDTTGDLISGQMAVVKGGPWESYAQLWVQRFKTQLVDADNSSVIKGWVEGGLRERIDRFLAEGGVDKALEGVDVSLRGLVHGDFTMNNVLFDGTTKRITALLDFDWSAISHPIDDFLTGLWDVGGGLNDERSVFQEAILTGNFDVQPDGLSDEDVEKWQIAKAWNAAASEKGAARPDSIAGARRIQTLRELEQAICPFALGNEVMLKRFSDDVKAKKRAEAEAKVAEGLAGYGY